MKTQTENTINLNEQQSVPFMSTLTERVNKAMKEGYSETLKMTKQGIFYESRNKTYLPDEVKVVDFYRFEGQSDPADSAIMYVIETTDGVKGLLIDSYGAYADEYMNKFMAEVEEIKKKEAK